MATTFTVYDLDAHKLCQEYSLDNLVKLWDGREALSLLEIFDLPIPDHDRIGVSFLKGMLEREKQDALIETILTRHIQGITSEDIETLAWKTQWLNGTDRTQETAEYVAWQTETRDPKVSLIAKAAATAKERQVLIAKAAATAKERQVGKDPDAPNPNTREYRACRILAGEDAQEWQTQVQEALDIIKPTQEERR